MALIAPKPAARVNGRDTYFTRPRAHHRYSGNSKHRPVFTAEVVEALHFALGLGEREGFVKIIADARYGEIIDAHLVGPEVTELLPELVLAKTWELTPEEIARSVHAHPTLSEVIMEASHGVFGAAIHM